MTNPHLPVAQTKNWRAYGIAAVVGATVTSAAVWLVIDTSKPPPKQDDIVMRGDRSSMDRWPARDFAPPPQTPPPPAPAPIIVQAPAAQPPAPPPLRPPPPAPPLRPPPPAPPPPPPAPLKPISTLKVTDGDDDFFKEKNINGVSGIIPADQPDSRPGESAATRWLTSAGNAGKDFVTTPFSPPISKYMLQAGVIISATTLNAVNSDLPGDVVAMINDDVPDTPTGQHVLIPASAKLYGRYSDELVYGQNRAQVAWTRILFPDGSSQNVGSMGGTDAAGAAGVEGEVDRHVGAMAGAIGLSAFMSILGQAGTLLQGDSGTTNIGSIGADGGARTTQSIAGDIASKELNRPNTIYLPQGSTVGIMLTRDIALPQWNGGHPWREDR